MYNPKSFGRSYATIKIQSVISITLKSFLMSLCYLFLLLTLVLGDQWLVWIFSISHCWNHIICNFCSWLPSFILKTLDASSFCICPYLTLFYSWVVVCCVAIPHFVYPLSSWEAFTLYFHLLALWGVLLWRFTGKDLRTENLFLFVLSLYLDHVVILCIAYWGIAKLLSIVAIPFHIHTNKVQGSSLSSPPRH